VNQLDVTSIKASLVADLQQNQRNYHSGKMVETKTLVLPCFEAGSRTLCVLGSAVASKEVWDADASFLLPAAEARDANFASRCCR